MAAFDLKAIVETLNAAALDPTRWSAALETLVSQTNSFGSVVFPLMGPMPYIPATRSMDESFEVYVRDGWVSRDERFRARSKLLRSGIATDRDVMPAEELKRNPYYQDFLARCNLKDVAAVRVGTGEHVWSLTVHRTFQQESFSAAEVETLRQLAVQLSSTAEVATAFGVARGAAALSAFDVAGKAAVLLNRQGDVVRANALAEELFDVHVRVTRGRLTSTNKAARDSFETALKRLLWSLDVSGVPPFPSLGPAVARSSST